MQSITSTVIECFTQSYLCSLLQPRKLSKHRDINYIFTKIYCLLQLGLVDYITVAESSFKMYVLNICHLNKNINHHKNFLGRLWTNLLWVMDVKPFFYALQWTPKWFLISWNFWFESQWWTVIIAVGAYFESQFDPFRPYIWKMRCFSK